MHLDAALELQATLSLSVPAVTSTSKNHRWGSPSTMQSELSSYFGSQASAPCCERRTWSQGPCLPTLYVQLACSTFAGAIFVPFTQQHQRAFVASALEFEFNSTGVTTLEIISYRYAALQTVPGLWCGPFRAAHAVPRSAVTRGSGCLSAPFSAQALFPLTGKLRVCEVQVS